jgi:hypothetical protein
MGNGFDLAKRLFSTTPGRHNEKRPVAPRARNRPFVTSVTMVVINATQPPLLAGKTKPDVLMCWSGQPDSKPAGSARCVWRRTGSRRRPNVIL